MERIIQLLISSFWPLMKAGLKMTVPLTLVSFALGMILAFVTAMCRISKNKLLSKTAQFYVWVIRGTPMIRNFLRSAQSWNHVFAYCICHYRSDDQRRRL